VTSFSTFQQEAWKRHRTGLPRFTPELDARLREIAGTMTRREAAALLDVPYTTLVARVTRLNIKWPAHRARVNNIVRLSRDQLARNGAKTIRKLHTRQLARNVAKYLRAAEAIEVPDWVPLKWDTEYRALCVHRNERFAQAVIRSRMPEEQQARMLRFARPVRQAGRAVG
jgi:hypothetical protein